MFAICCVKWYNKRKRISVSKILLNDDDATEILDYLVYQALTHPIEKEAQTADYLADKLCTTTRRDYLEYVDLVKKWRKVI